MIRRYTSAGAVVVTADLTDPRTLLLDQTRVTGEQQTVAPKGRIEPGESPLAAAIREVAEETGLTTASYAGYLGQEAYEFTDNDGTPAAKTVDWFLLTTATTATDARTTEGFTNASWLTFDQAGQAASHSGFVTYLRRAAGLVAWRRAGPLPFSTAVDGVVQEVADAAQPLLRGMPGAGVAICGSSARGDFVEGWSDIDLVGYGLPAGSPAVEQLTALVRDTATRHAVHASLHLADRDGRSLRNAGPLYDMKLRTALRRVGCDVAVIAGTQPTVIPPAPDRAEISAGLADLHAFATDRLAVPATDTANRTDRARRVLSVTCSAARLLAVSSDPDASLRLPAVTDLLEHHHPGTPAVSFLRDYDIFRQRGAGDLDHAERLAEQAPPAIGDLIERHRTPAPAGG